MGMTTERISAAEVKVGDVVQHHLKRWQPQTVTAVTERYGFASPTTLIFDLSGGSRVVGVPLDVVFLRYDSDKETT